MTQKMKRILAYLIKKLIGIICIALSALAFIVMLAYYQEPVAIWPAMATMIMFICSVVCFTEE